MLSVAVCGKTISATVSHASAVREWAEKRSETFSVTEYDIAELLEAAGSLEHDIVILEAEYSSVSGLYAAGVVRGAMPGAEIIMLADTGAMARQAYAQCISRYLVRPYGVDKLTEALEFALKAATARKRTASETLLHASVITDKSARVRDIMYITNSKHEHVISFSDGKKTRGKHRSSLGEHFSELLVLPSFVRANSSCIVNLCFVKEVYHNCIITTDSTHVNVGRNHRAELLEKVRRAVACGEAYADIRLYTTSLKKQETE